MEDGWIIVGGSAEKQVALTIYTVGHGSPTQEELLDLLKLHRVQVVVDVRPWPTSKREHIRRERLDRWLPAEGTTTDGVKQRLPGMAAFQFRKGKVQEVHDYYDSLLIAQQLARGWLAKMVVSAVVNRMEKGLHRRSSYNRRHTHAIAACTTPVGLKTQEAILDNCWSIGCYCE